MASSRTRGESGPRVHWDLGKEGGFGAWSVGLRGAEGRRARTSAGRELGACKLFLRRAVGGH